MMISIFFIFWIALNFTFGKTTVYGRRNVFSKPILKGDMWIII